MGHPFDPFPAVIPENVPPHGVQNHLPHSGVVVRVQAVVPPEADLHRELQQLPGDPRPPHAQRRELVELPGVPASGVVGLPAPVGVEAVPPVPRRLALPRGRVGDGKANHLPSSSASPAAAPATARLTSGGSRASRLRLSLLARQTRRKLLATTLLNASESIWDHS